MRKIGYLLMILLLISCGSNMTTSTNQDTGTVSATGQSGTVERPRITVQSILSNMARGEYVKGEVLVKFKPDAPSGVISDLHQRVGVASRKVVGTVPNLERVRLPEGVSVEDAIIQYMSDPNVEYAEPNYIIRTFTMPNDTYFQPNQWALHNTGSYAGGTPDADIDAPEAWDTTTGSSNIIIAITDTGVDYNHPDLVGNIWINEDEDCNEEAGAEDDDDMNGYVNDCVGWDFTTCERYVYDEENMEWICDEAKDPDSDPMDEHGHGTHVAGIIGAKGNNAEGIAGVMWNVRLMALSFLNAQGVGDIEGAVNAIEYAVSNGARIINASWGSYDYSYSLYEAISTANSAGVLFIAAAGNEENNNDAESPLYPASYNLPNIIAVAATDQNDMRAHFSNYGLSSVDVAAPGVYIFSTVPIWWSGYPGYGEVERFSGTSMAAPHVAGIAGLIYSHYDGVHNTAFTYTQVRDTILRYVDILPSLQGWIKTGGRVNAHLAVASLLIPTDLTAIAQSPTEVTLSWTDNATGEDGYILERRTTDGNFSVIADLPPDTTTYTDTDLYPLTTYIYRIKVYNNISESFYSNEVSVTTPETEPKRGGGGGCSLVTGPSDQPVDIAILLIPALTILIALRRKGR
jgi:subtilisin family serine protease